MGVLLQAFFRTGEKGAPCPSDGDRGADWWWDHLAMQAHAIRKAGFTAVWLPPVLKGASGIQSVGYDPFDDYDLGAKYQCGTRPTRYGTREQLARCVAMLRANDQQVLALVKGIDRADGDAVGVLAVDARLADDVCHGERASGPPRE